MRRAPKLDVGHAAIVEALRKVPGVTVQSLAPVGDGVPDLLVGTRDTKGRPLNLLLEVKRPDTNKKGRRLWVLTPDQKLWHAAWTGQVCVVCSPEEALAVVQTARRTG